MNHHDIVVLEFRTSSAANMHKLKTGVPVLLRWKQGGNSQTIHGYVTHVSAETVGQKKAKMKVYVVGGSYPLKARSTKIYKKKTIPEVAGLIAKQFGLKFAGETHGQQFNQIAISGHSFWEWLVEQADRIGFGLRVDNLSLVFKSIDKLIFQSISNAPVMSMFNIPQPIGALFLDRTLDYFEVQNGENIEQDDNLRTIKNIGGVNPLTGKPFTSKAQPKTVGKKTRKTVSDNLFDEFVVGLPVNDAASARLTALGAAQKARFNIPAVVKGQGDPRMKPYSTVYINGTGSETDGFWVIETVTHFLGFKGTYDVEMLVRTDGVGQPVASMPAPFGGSTGLIDVVAALEDGGISGSSIRNEATLVSKSELFQEGNQGFTRTPARWKSNNIGPRKVC